MCITEKMVMLPFVYLNTGDKTAGVHHPLHWDLRAEHGGTKPADWDGCQQETQPFMIHLALSFKFLQMLASYGPD